MEGGGGGGGGGTNQQQHRGRRGERTKVRDHLFKSFWLISNVIHGILAVLEQVINGLLHAII